MRRLLALLLLMTVPLQFFWSAAHAMQGHAADNVEATGFHSHHDHVGAMAADDDHDHAGPASGDTAPGHQDDGHHGHFHPVFSPLVMEAATAMPPSFEPDGPPARPPAVFSSHIPPPLDRPPLLRI